MTAPCPNHMHLTRLQHPGSTETQAVVLNLRELADECLDRIDGAEESSGYDSWLTTLAEGLRHAALLLDERK